MKRSTSAGLLIALTAGIVSTGAGAEGACQVADAQLQAPRIARTDHQASGNRVVGSCGFASSGAAVDVELGGAPSWVLPDPTAGGLAWLVAGDDGAVVRVVLDADGGAMIEPSVLVTLEPGEPPLATVTDGGVLEVRSALEGARRFQDAIPGARVVSIDSETQAALTGPTDRYPHGVLGDGLEATGVSVGSPTLPEVFIGVGETAVIEGLSPIVAELDGNDAPELLVTVSDMYEGARLVAYDLDGRRVAASEPIGRSFRWLHQIGVGPTGPGGEVEVIVVRTPHIGGVLEAYQLSDGQLRRAASESGFSSHQLGSPNLDMALLADADGDNRLEVIVPSQDMRSLGILARTEDGFSVADSLLLGGRLSTNIAAAIDVQGHLVLAVGTDDGRLRVFS